MTDHTLDPVIHAPTRLKIIASLAALPAGDAPATVALTGDGRAALDRYTAALRQAPQVAGELSQAARDLPA